MNSTSFFILNSVLGAIIIALGVALILLLKKLKAIRTNLGQEMQDSNLEEVIIAITKKIKNLENSTEALKLELESLKEKSTGYLRGVGVHRFDAFEDAGGSLSFSAAVINERDSGFIITSIHGRAQNRIYSKQIKDGKGEVELTKEEVSALSIAKANNIN